MGLFFSLYRAPDACRENGWAPAKSNTQETPLTRALHGFRKYCGERREGGGGRGLISKMWKIWSFYAVISPSNHSGAVSSSHFNETKMSHLCRWRRPYSSHITGWRNTEWLLHGDFLTFHLKNSCIFCTLYFDVSFLSFKSFQSPSMHSGGFTGHNFQQWSSSSAEILNHTDTYIMLPIKHL